MIRNNWIATRPLFPIIRFTRNVVYQHDHPYDIDVKQKMIQSLKVPWWNNPFHLGKCSFLAIRFSFDVRSFSVWYTQSGE